MVFRRGDNLTTLDYDDTVIEPLVLVTRTRYPRSIRHVLLRYIRVLDWKYCRFMHRLRGFMRENPGLVWDIQYYMVLGTVYIIMIIIKKDIIGKGFNKWWTPQRKKKLKPVIRFIIKILKRFTRYLEEWI